MTETVTYELIDGIAVLTIAHPPVNATSQKVREALKDAVLRLNDDADALGGILTGDGSIFVGGADIREFGKTPMPPALPEIINLIEDSAKPIVAAINGVALGGGCELTLGAHARIGTPGARIGLPEVTLGLIPGAGGTQRLPRLIEIGTALDLITSGRQLTAAEALDCGLFDQIAEPADLLASASALARELAAAPQTIRRLSYLPAPQADASVFEKARAACRARYKGQINQLAAVDAVEAATRLDREAGMAEERRLFLSLMSTPQRAALIHAFFAERKAAHVPDIKDIAVEPIEEVGIIGGGTMGAGIATAAAMAGYRVTLVEREEEFAARARATIEKNLARALERKTLKPADHAAILGERLKTCVGYENLSTADVIIEAVFENMDVKQEVFRALDGIAKKGATLATNTSYLDVNAIAAVTSRPEDVIGLHFFSPAHVMRLLEVVVADKTSGTQVARAFALARRMKKTAVRAGVCDGFIGNRILAHYRLAADYMMMDGASPYDIDAALTDFGFAMGPFQVADLAGIDIGYATRQRRAPARHPDERYVGFADALYHKGWLGQKTGRGFYIYDAEAPKGRPDPEVSAMLDGARKAEGIAPRTFTAEEIQDRYMAAMINEGARVLEDGIAQRPSDIDVVFLAGYGFPRWRGGPMQYADEIGLDTVLNRIRTYAAEDAHYWSPARLLEKLVAEGKTFKDLNEASA
ncbi:3-hydroxyacyl-CoA dehydrogenase NAD-binding domain-containing protein [Roseibium aestuarii]|uniref:3-hydroxyacyl-CoA dehydrogenase NAD-binding domain-containing protein n=1 Tax=Roseibium aestuarii TaxID=2600299 RepID=A0ABW4JTX0_9HYPH|nr:3-hydroxyacyl-CoA dehydrogenase NAD-binding domain-containing protein [Roseibium aestuarii]